MLFNFCDPRLRPDIQCSTVSTEGHEVTNLITDSSKGFLAYSCIKPPVNIDITFLCNIRINHILIWPYVGSQKSSGFQLYAKASNAASVPYTLLSTGYLDRKDSGLLFYPSNVNLETVTGPQNFVKRYIKSSMQYLTTYTSTLRICICKTENSVPALGKIEVWGTVSPRCGKDTIASVYTLWCTQVNNQTSLPEPVAIDDPPAAEKEREVPELPLEVPECFLDAITYEIMTQPTTLPSGKIVDQTTLQKHEENEALWGRAITDPFTGIPFNEYRKPIVASALKTRIDKFLLENSNAEEIKKLPRVLGRAMPSAVKDKIRLDASRSVKLKEVSNQSLNVSKPQFHSIVTSLPTEKKYCHKLPVIAMSSKQNVIGLTQPAKRRKVSNSCILTCEKVQEKTDAENCTDTIALDIESNADFNTTTGIPNLKRFGVTSGKCETSVALHSCTCCTNGIFYQLPCEHVVCRKVISSIENNQCTLCGTSYKTGEIQRIHE